MLILPSSGLYSGNSTYFSRSCRYNYTTTQLHILESKMRATYFPFHSSVPFAHQLVHLKCLCYMTPVSPFACNTQCFYNIPFRQIYIYIYRVSQEECARLREGVPYVKVYRYNPKHLCPKLKGYGDNGHRKVWASAVSTYCTPSVTPYSSTAHARQRDITS